jgi:hypothetical protein
MYFWSAKKMSNIQNTIIAVSNFHCFPICGYDLIPRSPCIIGPLSKETIGFLSRLVLSLVSRLW